MPTREIELPRIRYLQILDENGQLDGELEPDLSEERLLELYRAMTLAREADERMLKLQRQGRLGTFGPSSGQEAAHCAPTFAMSEKDWFIGSFRELGARLMRGDSFTDYLRVHNGWEEGNASDPARRTLPYSVIVGAQCLHAAGIAYQIKYSGEEKAAAVCFFGDGATSQGDFHEALNFAAVWKAPVVFVCQNNQWAISIPRSQQTTSKTIAQKALAYDIPGIQVDGNDPLAMYAATREALDRAYAGEGPTLIEAVTYRVMMHTTSDDPTRYRDDAETAKWRKRDPLIRFRKYLERTAGWTDERQTALEAEVKAEVEASVKELESDAPFDPAACFDYLYAEMPPIIAAQREEFVRSLEADRAAGQEG